MKIYVDTAKLEEIEEAISWGIVDGVTTNPSLLRAAIEEEEGKELESQVKRICEVVGEGKPVSLEVLSQKADGIIKEAKTLYEKFNPIANNVVIKIPVNTYTEDADVTNYEGLKAIKAVTSEDVPVNATLAMSPEQALLAAKAGATYVSPFAGRVDDYVRNNLGISFEKHDYFDFNLVEEISNQKRSKTLKESSDKTSTLYSNKKIKELTDPGLNQGVISGVDLVGSIVQILERYSIETKVIAASMRHPRQVREVSEIGADIATIPFSVLQAMLKHPKTKEGVKRFYADAMKAEYEELF